QATEPTNESVTFPQSGNFTNSTMNDSGFTSNTYFPYYQHSLPIAASFILVYLFIFLLCMVGNGLVCLIVLENRGMRTVTNLFILNLAVSDLLVGIFCIPTTLVDNLITGWPFTNPVCKMSGLVQGMSVSASVFTLVAIAVDRFRCIVYPFQPKLTLLVAKATIVLIWVLALVIMCPSAAMLTVERVEDHYMVHNKDYNQTSPLYRCYENWPDPEMRKIYTMVLFTHIYLVPLTLITLMYGRIGVKLCTTSVVSGGEPQETVQAHSASATSSDRQNEARPVISHKKIKVIKMLSVVALLFMLSWLPLWTLMLLIDYGGLNEEQLELLTGYFFPFAHWLAFSNSSVNPIIYGYYNENFKRGFQATCRTYSCCCPLRIGARPKECRVAGATSGLRNVTANTNTLTFVPKNRVHTNEDLHGAVHLELELRNKASSCSEDGVSVPGAASAVDNQKSKKVLKTETLDKMAVSQAWDC
uniref:Neuropeptide FF receptor 1 n=1 Tax=Denticeps clupeoides TaxID=299321 RepID=A0AAY4BFX7_9TELE